MRKSFLNELHATMLDVIRGTRDSQLFLSFIIKGVGQWLGRGSWHQSFVSFLVFKLGEKISCFGSIGLSCKEGVNVNIINKGLEELCF